MCVAEITRFQCKSSSVASASRLGKPRIANVSLARGHHEQSNNLRFYQKGRKTKIYLTVSIRTPDRSELSQRIPDPTRLLSLFFVNN